MTLMTGFVVQGQQYIILDAINRDYSFDSTTRFHPPECSLGECTSPMLDAGESACWRALKRAVGEM